MAEYPKWGRDDVEDPQPTNAELWNKVDKGEDALEKLTNQVMNLAVKLYRINEKLDKHLKTPDAHNPGTMGRK